MRKFLYTFLLILISCLMLGVMVSAEGENTSTSVSIPQEGDTNITWEVTYTDYATPVEKDGLTFSGSASIVKVSLVNYTKNGFNIPSYFTIEKKNYEVTELCDNAFSESGLFVFGKVALPKYLTKIGANAFKGTRIYGDLVIPDTVTDIGEGAFYNCNGITSVTLPVNFLSIPKEAFRGCLSLISVYSYSQLEGETEKQEANLFFVGSRAFQKCESLLNVSIGSDTNKINDHAFYECRSLGGTIDLSALTVLGSNAFDFCSNIEEFILPENCFQNDAFTECYKLKRFSYPDGVSESSHYYIDDNGVLFSYDKKILYNYPAKLKLSRYEIPSGVTKISDQAFLMANDLVYVNIPDSVTEIGNQAFAWTSLETFYAPNNVSKFGDKVLEKCSNLKWVVLGEKVPNASNLLNECNEADLPEIIIYRNISFTIPYTDSKASLFISENSYLCINHYFGYRGTPATCTESGINECVACSFKVFAKATGHTGSIVEISELSCTTDSYVVYDCPNCDDVNDINYPYATVVYATATGHTADPKTVPASDTTPGYTITICTTCNETIVSDYETNFYTLGDVNDDGAITADDISILAQYIGGVALYINPVSCDLNGNQEVDIFDLIILKRFVEKRDELPEISPICAKHMHVKSLSVTESSCIGSEVTLIYCADCGMLIDSVVSDPLGHDWVYSTNYEPTCKSTGRIVKQCSVCKERVEETIEKVPHTGAWWTISGQREYQYRNCTVCGAFDSSRVDYTEFEKVLNQLSPNYLRYFDLAEDDKKLHTLYYTEDTLALLAPIMENYQRALSQEQVDQNTEELKKILPRLEYNVYGVPSIYITTDADAELKRNMPYIDAEIAVAYFDENGKYVDYIERSGEMKVRGNSTADSKTKKPYNIKFNSDVDLFGLGADNKYCLLANAYEPTLMRNAVVRYFNKIIGLDHYCKFEFVDVYCNNKFYGNYMLCTPVDIEETRVNIDKDSDFILEVENKGSAVGDKNALYIQSPYTNFSIKVDSHDIEDISSSGYSSLYNTIYQADFALMSGDWNEIQKYFDVDSLARYYILHEYLKDVDYAWDSTRFCLENGKITAGPAWDFDRAIGHANRFGGDGSRVSYYNSSERLSIGGVTLDGATGTWANVVYEGMPRLEYDETNTTPDKLWINNPVSGNFVQAHGNNNNWMTFLYLYSPEFMDLVCNYIWEYRDKLQVLYKDTIDSLGKVNRNYIDTLYKDVDFYESALRNYDSTGAGHKLYDSSAEDWRFTTYPAAVDQLRQWLESRYNWMINFYCFEYQEADKATDLLEEYDNNILCATTTASLTRENKEFIYTVNIDGPADFNHKTHFESMCKLIQPCFNYFKKVKVVFNYTLEGKKTTPLTKTFENENPNSFMEMRLDTLNTVLTTNKKVNKYTDNTVVSYVKNGSAYTVTVTIDVTDSKSYYKDDGKVVNDKVKEHYLSTYDQISQYLYNREFYDLSAKNEIIFVYNFDNNETKTFTIDKRSIIIK